MRCVTLLCSGLFSHHFLYKSCTCVVKSSSFVLLDGLPYVRSTSDICSGSLLSIAKYNLSPSSVVVLSMCPTMPKSSSPILPFLSSRTFPGWRSAWNVPVLNIWSRKASIIFFAICGLSVLLVSDSFLPSRYSIVNTFSVVCDQYT